MNTLRKEELIDLFLYKNNVSERASGIIKDQIDSLEKKLKKSVGEEIFVQSMHLSQQVRTGLEKDEEDEDRIKLTSDKTRTYGVIGGGDLTIDSFFYIIIPTDKHMTYYEDGVQEGGIRIPMKMHSNHAKLPICINPRRSTLYGIENTTDIHIGNIVRKIFPGGDLGYAKARDLLGLDVPEELKNDLEAFHLDVLMKTIEEMDMYINRYLPSDDDYLKSIKKSTFPEGSFTKLKDLKEKICDISNKLDTNTVQIGNVPGKFIKISAYLESIYNIMAKIKQ
ncbi:TPA: hypothetical protein HA293_03640 [Candidatus Woesearchaeota archaeon]|nr:hypothetical protein [Candidatus Woesearchaeota archaeon]